LTNFVGGKIWNLQKKLTPVPTKPIPAMRMFILLIPILLGRTEAFAPPVVSYGRSLPTTLKSSVEASSVTFHVAKRCSADESRAAIDDILLPTHEYGKRIRYGRDAQELNLSAAVQANDPRMAFTYGEFPIHSFDALLDLAMTYMPPHTNQGPLQFVDIGSGCGRLAYHAGLTRGTANEPWNTHGIEMYDILHREALRGMRIGLDETLFTSQASSSTNSIMFHLGDAGDMKHIFADCRLAFAYSTTWPCSGFSEQMCAMVLHGDWSHLLSKSCPKGCVVVTTDRALDPEYGWELVDRLDVENREVAGSTGYIHILR
jgi:hypothetical protein